MSSGKTAFVTGGSRGIGRAVVRRLAAEGYAVGIDYLQAKDQAEALEAELRAQGARALAVQADVSDRDAVTAAIRTVEEAFGPIDLLVNNAGIAGQHQFQDITDEFWRRLFAVNVDGAFHTIQAVLPHMIHVKAGSIVNISSIWGQRGASCEAAYSAAKGAVIAYTKALAKELGPSSIRVNCVAPGVIDTEMNAHLSPDDLAALAGETPLGRIGTPEEAAARHPRQKNLYLLTAPARSGAAEIDREAFLALFPEIQSRFRYCLVDAPAGLGAGFRLALAGADRAVVVTTTDASALRDAQRTVMELGCLGRGQVHLVVNRCRKKLMKSLHLTVDDAIDAAGLPLLGIIPEDETMPLYAGRGVLLLSSGNNYAAKAYRNIARRIDGRRVSLMQIR